jgi:hypothetical protein
MVFGYLFCDLLGIWNCNKYLSAVAAHTKLVDQIQSTNKMDSIA